MKLSGHQKRIALIVALAVFGAGIVPTAMAARIAGKQCAGTVSKQKNPQTGETSRSCRTVDGDIATEKGK